MAAEDTRPFAVLAMDGSGRYAVSDSLTVARMRAEEYADRQGVTMIVSRWNGSDWREKGHWVEYAERVDFTAFPKAVA